MQAAIEKKPSKANKNPLRNYRGPGKATVLRSSGKRLSVK